MRLFLQSADGTGTAEPLSVAVSGALSPEGWTSDGRIVVTQQSATTTGSTSVSCRRAATASNRSSAHQPMKTASRFHRTVAGLPMSVLASRGLCRALSRRRRPPSHFCPEGGEDPLWSQTGRELFYRRLKDTAVMVVPISTSPTFSAGSPKMLFRGDYFDTGGRHYDVDRAGQRFLTFKELAATSGGPTPRLILVQNFSKSSSAWSRRIDECRVGSSRSRT